MAIIAIAGGTSPTLGKAIVTAVGHTPIKAVILSRKDASKSTQPSTCYGIEVRYVDYSSSKSLEDALEDVQTLISVLKIPGPEWLTYQLNLLNAAKIAGVKRFAPSEFGLGPLSDGKVDILGLKPAIWQACQSSGLECTRFCCGMFMNYLANGYERLDGTQKAVLLHGLEGTAIIWNIQAGKAELPMKDDGSSPRITLTEIGDVGRMVAAACQLPLGSWRPTMGMVGETINLDLITQLLEQKLKVKFDVRKVKACELQRRATSIQGLGNDRTEIFGKMISQMSLLALEEKDGMSIIEPVVNQMCPDVKPLSVIQYLEKVAS